MAHQRLRATHHGNNRVVLLLRGAKSLRSWPTTFSSNVKFLKKCLLSDGFGFWQVNHSQVWCQHVLTLSAAKPWWVALETSRVSHRKAYISGNCGPKCSSLLCAYGHFSMSFDVSYWLLRSFEPAANISCMEVVDSLPWLPLGRYTQSNVVPKLGSCDLVMHKMNRASDYIRLIYIYIYINIHIYI